MNTGVKRPLFYTILHSPLGAIYIAFTKKGVSRIDLGVDSVKVFVRDLEENYNRVAKRSIRGLLHLKREIRAYFSSPRKRRDILCKQRTTDYNGRSFFFRTPIDPLEGTPFEKEVWLQIRKIPYGKVISYKDLAIKVGRPKAARAVGLACKKNPLSILIPCHRVIGKDRSLRGYSAGIKIKRTLLKMEGVQNISL